MSSTFKIIKKSSKSKARAGILTTPHGEIHTPVFMPVGTQSTVKAMTPEMVKECGAQIILANTYHLSLRPGADLINDFGGLHPWMNWKGPILTDSGGYQVFSLSNMRKITPEGVSFKSHIDGSVHHFSPKSVVELQLKFNSDILMPLDICSPHTATEQDIINDLAITHAWEKEAYLHWKSKDVQNQLFAIVQGGMFTHLRDQSIDFLTQLDFPGFALGGVSVGESRQEMETIIGHSIPKFPENKPRYVMGIGLPENLKIGIEHGVDMFDCVIPTRLARHGQAFIPGGKLTIKNEIHKKDPSPIDPTCACYCCAHYSRAYLRHLFMAKEILALTLMSIHNVHFLVQLVDKMRAGILEED